MQVVPHKKSLDRRFGASLSFSCDSYDIRPAQGQKKALAAIADIGPEGIVYVSCDSASLARDLAYLAERGYKVVEVQPVDMFPQTAQDECIALIERK